MIKNLITIALTLITILLLLERKELIKHKENSLNENLYSYTFSPDASLDRFNSERLDSLTVQCQNQIKRLHEQVLLNISMDTNMVLTFGSYKMIQHFRNSEIGLGWDFTGMKQECLLKR